MNELERRADSISEEAKSNYAAAQSPTCLNGSSPGESYVRAAVHCRWIELVYRLANELIQLAKEAK